MIESMKRMTNRTGLALSASAKYLLRSRVAQYCLFFIATAATFVGGQIAHATITYTVPTTNTTGLENTTYTVYDIINSILAVIYPSIIPILVAGSTIFAAWWVWHRLRGAVS